MIMKTFALVLAVVVTTSAGIVLPSALPSVGAALAQPAPANKPIAAGTRVTLARPAEVDEVLLRLVGLECSAATKLHKNADGTYDGSLTCGSVTLKAKRLTLDQRGIQL